MKIILDSEYISYRNDNYTVVCTYETESLLNPNKVWEFTIYDEDEEVLLTMKVKDSKSSVGGIGKQKTNQVLSVFGFEL